MSRFGSSGVSALELPVATQHAAREIQGAF